MARLKTAWLIPAVPAIVLLTSFGARVAAQQPVLADILARAGERAAATADTARAFLAEEKYKQVLGKVRSIEGFMTSTLSHEQEVRTDTVETRDWVAEVAIVGTPEYAQAGFPFCEFRDVIMVGKDKQRDGTSRLPRMVAQAPGIAGPLGVEVSQQAADQILGRIQRVILIPRNAAIFLHPLNQPRFEFSKGSDKKIEGIKAFEIRFKEKRSPSMVRGSNDKNAPTSGSIWVDPATGEILMSVVKSPDSDTVYDELTVTYAKDPESGLRLPATLAEKLVDDDGQLRLEGKATFTKWHAIERKTR